MGWRSGQSYSQDLRDRVLGSVGGGTAVRQAAIQFRVSIAYIFMALTKRRLTGACGIDLNRGHHPRKLSPDQERALAAHMRSAQGVTLVQAQAWLLSEHGVALSAGAIWNAVRRLGLSFKTSLARGRAGTAQRRSRPRDLAGGPTLH